MTDDEKRDASSAAWLAEVCKNDMFTRSLTLNPWTVAMAGESWTIATNGHRMVGLRGEFGYPVASPTDAATLVGVLDKPFAMPSRRVDLTLLRQFVGCDAPDAPPKPDCATCGNEGTIECKACNGEAGDDCECADDGEVDCPDCDRAQPAAMNKGRIFGHLFNRDIMVTPLQHLPGESALWIEGDKTGSHRLDGDGWRLMVMPIRDEDVPPTDAPEFAAFVPEKAAVVHD